MESIQPIEKEGILAEEDGEADVPNVDSVPVESTQPIEREGILAEEDGEADVPNVDSVPVESIQPIEKEGILAVGDGEADVSYIDSLQVEGNQRIEKEAILAVITTRKGDRLDYDQLDRDLRDIYRMKYFKDVKIDIKDGLEGKAVSFIVSEKPSIGEIVFDGNSKKKDEDLKEEVGINLYSILDDNEISQSINRLLDYYREKGYFNAEIKADVESLPNNEVRVKYQIVENDKIYIKKIEFLGNNKFDDGDLKDVMKSSEKGWFSWITDSGFLNEKMLEYDVHMITTFYHNHGYINAKVGEPEITFNDKGITITLEIEEGEEYSVNSVAVAGDLIMTEDAFLAQVFIGKEGVFNREVLRNDILALKDIYVDAGFAYAEVAPRTKQDNEKHFVDITYVISKGPKVRFERINVIGNTITRDKVIRRELKAIEGG
ncbi:MAG: outer membrane protein assembly factor BamA, partial [Deltaproteobacteria bacterium]|nr:outer membrane protein assembly factor BamA [Deltaproteobacteria bacterium]